MIEAKIERKIVSNNKEFKICDNTYFKWNQNGKTYEVTGNIKGIDDDGFCIDNVKLDGMNMYDALFVKFTDVQDGVLTHPFNGISNPFEKGVVKDGI